MWFLRACTVVRTPAETVSAVGAALAQPSALSTARQRARALFAAPGTATQRALAIVYELLGVAPLEMACRRVDPPALSPLAGMGR